MIEHATGGQRLCKRWQQERQFRLTASKFRVVVKHRRNHTALVKQLLYTKVFSDGMSALVWGQQHEADALEAYKLTLESGSTLRDASIYIGDCGFLGASPDGVVVDHSGDIV